MICCARENGAATPTFLRCVLRGRNLSFFSAADCPAEVVGRRQMQLSHYETLLLLQTVEHAAG